MSDSLPLTLVGGHREHWNSTYKTEKNDAQQLPCSMCVSQLPFNLQKQSLYRTQKQCYSPSGLAHQHIIPSTNLPAQSVGFNATTTAPSQKRKVL